MKKILKKYILLMSVLFVIMFTSGCEEGAEAVIDSYGTAMHAIEDRNTIALENIRDAGFLTKTECNKLVKALSKSINQDISTQVGDGEEDGSIIEVLKDAVVTNLANDNPDASDGAKWKTLVAANIKAKGDDAKPLTIFSEDELAPLNEKMSYKIYVLKTDDDFFYGQNIGMVTSALQNLDNAEGDFSGLEQDDKDVLNKIYTDSGTTLVDTTTIPVLANTKKNKGTVSGADNAIDKNKLGIDFAVSTNGLPGLIIRLYEINPKFLKAIGADGKAKDIAQKYVVDNTNKRIYLVNYPIFVLNSVTKEKIDGKWNWRCNFEYRVDSMRVNLKDGTITNKNGKKISGSPYLVSGGNKTTSFFFAEKGDTSGGNTSYTVEQVYRGSTSTDSTVKIRKKSKKVDGCLKICLADYLEMTYLPDVVSGEKYIALGRKIRLQALHGKSTDVFAKFIDRKGKYIDTNIKIYIGDLLDVRSGYKVQETSVNNTGVKSTIGKKWKNLKIKLAVGHKAETVAITTGNGNGTVGDTQENIGFKKVKYVNTKITPTRTFGYDGSNMYEFWGENRTDKSIVLGKENLFGSVDSSKYLTKLQNNKQLSNALMFGIATDVDIFKSALYSNWIAVEGNNGNIGSLEWWNKWLKKYKFNYEIDVDALMNALGMNYQISMGDADDTIIIDLDTIAKIQEEYDEQARQDKAKNIRTWFIGIGFICMAYALLLLGAWVFDTSLVGGPKLLGKLTFGRCVAVQGDLGIADSGDKRYMTFGKVFMFSLLVIAIGVVLILVDYVTIISWIIDTFGTFADIIKDIMLND